ncbi:MAG: DNA-processing protein DprA [Dyella sp.]
MNRHDDDWNWLLLLRTPGLGPGRLRRLLGQAGGDSAAALSLLERMPQPDAATRAWLRRPDEQRLRADLDWLAQPGCRLLRCTDEDFPAPLETIAQPPAALFVQGDASLLLRPQVAVVGARQASAGGVAHARQFAAALAQAGWLVTSGMAEGIDAAAHQAALDAQQPTVAVIGTGPDRVYPAKHRKLASIIAVHGVIVSEFLPGTAARADHFPRRNRLIAGLAQGTLVIEAGLQSGSLITARLAAEQGREVFALPGSIHNPLARGCHQLIRDGARLVETVDEVLQALLPAARALGVELAARLALDTATTRGQAPLAVPDQADPLAEQLLSALGHDPVGLDELVQRCEQPAAVLGARLLQLELDGLVESLAGNRYQRLPA